MNDGYGELGASDRRGVNAYLPMAVKYICALVLLIFMDAIWIKLLAPLLGIDYFGTVEKIQNAPVAWRWEGLLAYLVLGYAAAFMAQAPTPQESALQGAKIGFVIYSIFDFTTTFMFQGWTLKTAVLDTVWGTLMYSCIGFLLSYLSTTALWQRL